MVGKSDDRSPNRSCSPGSPSAKVQKRINLNKSILDPNEYRLLVLTSGLMIVLISGPTNYRPESVSDWESFHQGKISSPFSLDKICSWRSLYRLYSRKHKPRTCSAAAGKSEDEGDPVTSVTLSINIGGLHDPPSKQGLAHFIEHTVHYGTDKYADLDDIFSNFGNPNAFTTPDVTCYFGEISDVVLDEYLERFTDMLTNPLFEKRSLDKELEALDDEHYQDLPPTRDEFLATQFSITDQDHPLKNLLGGCVETLGRRDDCKKTVVTSDVVQATKEIHKKFYVASAMTATIHSTKPLNEMEVIALKYFGGFLKGDHRTYKDAELPLQEPMYHKNSHIYTQGLGMSHYLTFYWFIPTPMFGERKERVLEFVVNLLERTSEGSLLHSLWNRGWIYDSSVRIPVYNISISVIEIFLFLSEDGGKHVGEIEGYFSNYLQFLKGTGSAQIEYLFEEMRLYKLYRFHFASSEKSSADFCEEVTLWSQAFGGTPDLLLTESWEDAKFNHGHVCALLQYLLAKDHFFIVESRPKNLGLPKNMGAVKYAPYSDVQYVYEEIPSCSSPPPPNSFPRKEFSCAPNAYLELDLSCRKKLMKDDPKAPFIIKPNDVKEILPSLFMPKGSITGQHLGHEAPSNKRLYRYYASITVTFECNTLQTGRIWLWEACIWQLLTPLRSQLKNSGITVRTCGSWTGIKLNVFGRARHIVEVTKAILGKMLIPKSFTEQIVTLGKLEFSRRIKRIPILRDIVLSLFEIDQRESVESLSNNDLKPFIDSMRKSSKCHITLGENIHREAFEELAAHVHELANQVNCERPTACNQHSSHCRQHGPAHSLPILYDAFRESCVRMESEHSEEYRTFVTNVYCLGTYEENADDVDKFHMAMAFMPVEAFKMLRTEKQLGYENSAVQRDPERMRKERLIFEVSIHATARKHTTCKLDKAIDQFLADYGMILRNIPAEVYTKMVKITGINVPQKDVADWFTTKFPLTFGIRDVENKCKNAKIRKISYQVLPGIPEANPKLCDCLLCTNFKWKDSILFPGVRVAVGNKGTDAEHYFLQAPKLPP